MLTITVSGQEYFNNETQKFFCTEETVLELEHSLVSLSKWESKFLRPFLSDGSKTSIETLEYIKFMVLTPKIDPIIFGNLSTGNLTEILAYIESKETATTFTDLAETKNTKKDVITAELIYYWMTALNIPLECESWHLNRLFALIRISNIKQSKPKKMGKTEQAQQYRDLNAQRRAATGSSG